MESEDVYTLMMDALDGELSDAGWARLESHLRARPTLAREWQALQAVDTLFRNTPAIPPPVDFAQRTLARLPNIRQRLWISVIVYMVLLASGLAPLAAIGWLAVQFGPALLQPALASGLWQAAGEILTLVSLVLGALLSGAGQLVAEQPLLVGWLVVMVGVIAVWGTVYHRLVFQPATRQSHLGQR